MIERERVLMVLSSGVYPPDRRVQREAEVLAEEGCEVTLLARRGPGQAAVERVGDVEVLRFDLPFASSPRARDLWYYALDRYACAFRIARVARRRRASVIHVHDLPYAAAAVAAGRWLGVPVVVDLHEHYTAMLDVGFREPRYRAGRAIAPALLRVLRAEERFACRGAARVLVVTPEHVARIEGLGVARERIGVVGNAEDPAVLLSQAIDPRVAEQLSGDFTLLYAGLFDAHRGLETVLEAMPSVLAGEPRARLVLVGDGSLRGALEQRSRELGIAERVTFAGYQPFDSLRSWIEGSAVGLVPHRRTELVDVTMPNKIFQLMALGCPLVTSDAPPLRRVVESADCGRIFQDGDPVDLARAVLALRDDSVRRAMGERGRAAVADRYNWAVESRPLREAYRSLLREHARRLACATA